MTMENTLRRVLRVTPLAEFRLVLEYDDGSAVQVDFRSIIGQGGVFARLANPEFFKQVTVGDRGRSVEWPGDLDFCADALWLEGNGQANTN